MKGRNYKDNFCKKCELYIAHTPDKFNVICQKYKKSINICFVCNCSINITYREIEKIKKGE